MPPEARTFFDALPGAWTLQRNIDDARFGAGLFEGRATFTTQPDGTQLYQESGELHLSAWRGPAWRRWIYALEGEALAVRYPGTLAELHLFHFANGAARHTHICNADRYEAAFVSGADGSLLLTYTVTGPSKDYRLRTLLSRT